MYHYTSPLSIPGYNQSPEYLNGHKSGKSLDWDKSSDVDQFYRKNTSENLQNCCSLVCNTSSARHEGHACNTSNTNVTRVRHECGTNDTNAT